MQKLYAAESGGGSKSDPPRRPSGNITGVGGKSEGPKTADSGKTGGGKKS